MNSHTVSELIHQIKSLLEGEFVSTNVTGEISNLSRSSAGHWYFNLSDESASISCALFRMDAARNPMINKVKDGDQVKVIGPISVYQKRGTFQILVRKIQPAGVGNLLLQFEQLKARLNQKGYFEASSKKTIPKYPKKIAVITAKGAAALADFLNVMERRCLWYDIVLVPAVVQGEHSANSLLKAMKKAQQINDVELIVLTRGGGSMEDLWSFNDEGLVEEIFKCQIPVISAVGHQVDFTLCDFVSDHRSETPSAAAEFISQPQTQLKKQIRHLTHRLSQLTNENLYYANNQLSQYSVETLKTLLRDFIYQNKVKLDQYNSSQLLRSLEGTLKLKTKKLDRLNIGSRFYEVTRLHEHHMNLDDMYSRIKHSVTSLLRDYKNQVNTSHKLLANMDPKNVLKRGYTYLESDSGQVVSNTIELKKINSQDTMKIHFHDGVAKVRKV
jgi:exodeoxyribonuclease VII large subunit